MATLILILSAAYLVAGAAFVWALSAAFDVPLRETEASDIPSLLLCAILWPVIGIIVAYMYWSAITARVKAVWQRLRRKRLGSTVAVILIACLMFSGCSGCTSFNDVRAGMVASHSAAIQTSTNKLSSAEMGSPDWERLKAEEAARIAISNEVYQIIIEAPRSAIKVRKVSP